MADKFPKATLGQYKGLAVTRHVRPVLDSAVEAEIGHRCRLHARYVPTGAPAKRGDKVTLDFEGFLDGKPIPDSKMDDVTVLLGTGKLMPAAEKAIYGHQAGETFQFDFTYPQNFRVEKLSGVTAQFTITLHQVAEKHTPAADEDFARSRGFASLDAMRAQIRKEKAALHEENADRKAGQDLLEMAGANLTVTLPEKNVAGEAQREFKALEDQLKKTGLTLESYCQSCRTTPAQLKAKYRALAEKRIRSVLAVRAIAQAEGITASKEEVEAEYRRLAARQNISPEEVRKNLPADAVQTGLMAQKVQTFLLNNAQVTTIYDKAPAKKED